jgi:hypothetical protein|tara:strand:- start:5547 stop:5807 length:261 start_codon:yes stop_codon:yes gene_type:complete
MKLTKTKLKQLIVEEITGTRQGPFYDAKRIIFNLVDRIRHEDRMGRPVVIASAAGEDVDILAELTLALQALSMHGEEMRRDSDETY